MFPSLFSLLSGDHLPEEHCKYTKHLLFLLLFTHYSPIAHTSHILCVAKNMFFFFFFTMCSKQCLMLPPLCVVKGCLLSLSLSGAFLFLFESCDKRSVSCKNVLFHFQDVFLRWQLFRDMWWGGICIKKKMHKHFENLTCKNCSIQMQRCLKS